MNTASDIYMQRVIDTEKARVERADIRNRLKRELDEGTPRAQRAHRHGNMVLAIFTQFIPDACRPEAFEEAMLNFFAQDYEIVPVPPERDAETALKLREAMTTAVFPKTINA